MAPADASAVRAHRRSQVYRLAACKDYAGMTSANVVSFADAATTEQAGYRKAKDCP